MSADPSIGLFRTLFDQTSDLVWEIGTSAEIVRASPSHAETLGLDPRSLIGGPDVAAVHPEDRGRLAAICEAAVQGRSSEASSRLQQADGSWAWIGFRAIPHRGSDTAALLVGRPEGETGRERQELFRILAHNVPGTVYLCRNDADYTMLFLSADVETLTGFPASEFLSGSRSFVELYHPDDADAIVPLVDEALQNRRSFHLEYRLRHASGDYRWIEEHGQGVWNADGELIFLAGTLFDVTERYCEAEERRQLEQQLAQAQRLEALGLLVGGLAHDFNNLLAAVIGNIDLACRRAPIPRDALAHLDRASLAANRAREVTGQLLAYAGRGSGERHAVNVATCAAGLTNLLRATLPKTVQIELRADDDAWVEGDPAQIQQVLMNLVLNACEAMTQDGGHVDIEIRRTSIHRPLHLLAREEDALRPGDYVELIVRDDGCGMDEVTRKRIFDPFFTTKTAGHGLGLAAVRGIIRRHGGGLELESETGRGTTFRVLLPERDEPPSEEEAAREPALHGDERVLVVDDEDIVRHLTEHVLQHFGYEVVAAGSGREALELFDESIDLAVLDLTMPDMSGQSLYRLLRERSDLPVLFSSGYDATDIADRLQEDPRADFLQKPFTPEVLVARIRSLLAR